MSFVKEFVVPAGVLTGICAVVSGALVATYDVTQPIIEAAKIAKENEARSVVLTSADGFFEGSVSADNVSSVYVANNGVGYVFLADARGYGGTLNVMIGMDSDGIIEKVMLMDNSETQGLGTKVGDDAYTSQYNGKDINLEGIDSVSGATVSSNAFKSAVTSAYKAYAQMAGIEVEEEVLVFSLTPMDGADSAFTAVGAGFVGEISVDVHFDASGAVMAVVPSVSGETAGFGQKYGEGDYASQWEGKTDVSVDLISGATVTGEAINFAMENAFKAQKGEITVGEQSAAASTTPVETTDSAAGLPADATPVSGAESVYRSVQKGFASDVTVDVHLDGNGGIVAVELDVSGETAGFGQKYGEDDYTSLWAGKTDASVDVISGATVTGDAINTAVEEALANFGTGDSDVMGDVFVEKGFASDVTVGVEFDGNGAVASITLDVSGETAGFGQKYGDADYTANWIGKTEGTVDVISGATVTGDAINTAMAAAFASVGAGDSAGAVFVEKGFASDVTVGVEFDGNGAVASVTLDVSGETAGFGQKYGDADYTANWIGKTDGTVDVISGATVTGDAINAAMAAAFATQQGG